MRRLQATVKLVSLQSSYSQGLNLQLSSNPGKPHQGGRIRALTDGSVPH